MHIDRSALPRSKSPNANESFPIWEREGKKQNISLLLDIIPVLHMARVHTNHSELSQDLSCSCTPPTSLSRSLLSYLLVCLSHHLSHPSTSFSLCCVAVIFHRGELAEAVNTLLLRLRTQSDPATSVSLMPFPRSLIPRPL